MHHISASCSPGRNYSDRYVWYVVVVLTMVNVANYMDRMALSVLLPVIKTDLQLSDGQLGLLVGFAFAIFYAACCIPIARWADSGVRRNIIALALTTWSLMTVLSGAAQTFWQLFLCRIGVGAGEAGCVPPAQSLICDYAPAERRFGLFAVHNFGATVGMMLGMALAGWWAELIGWRWTFVALGVPGIALAVLVWFTIIEPERGRLEGTRVAPESISLGQTIRLLWSCKVYRLLVLFLVVNGFVQMGLNQWLPSYYSRIFGLSISSVGLYLGAALGISAGAGGLLGGLLANRVAKRDERLPMLISAGATFAGIPAAFASLLVSSASMSILLMAATSLLWNISNGPVIGSVYNVTDPQMRATAGAITIFFTSVFGFGLGPYFVGYMSEVFSDRLGAEGLRYALIAGVVLSPIMGITLLGIARSMFANAREKTEARETSLIAVRPSSR